MSKPKEVKSPIALFSPLAARLGNYGNAGCLLYLSNIPHYLHLVRAATLLNTDNIQGQPTQHFHALGQTSGLLRAAALTAFVYGKEGPQPHRSLRA